MHLKHGIFMVFELSFYGGGFYFSSTLKAGYYKFFFPYSPKPCSKQS